MKKALLVLGFLALFVSTAFSEVWVGGQLGLTSTLDSTVNFKAPPIKGTLNGVTTDWSGAFGVTLGYNFDAKLYKLPAWMDYCGVAIDFTYNSFNQPIQTRGGSFTPPFISQAVLPNVEGSQFALTFLAKVHYPAMKSNEFPKGRLFPFVMVGPSIVWTNSDFTNYGGGSQSSTDIGIVVDAGLDFYIIPNLSIGPVFRYRHVWGPSFDFRRTVNFITAKTNLDQFSTMLRVSYHF